MLLIVVSDVFTPRKQEKDYLFFLFIFVAAGQGIYFATDAIISHGYTHPDARKRRYMFMGKNVVLDLGSVLKN
jgi:hypothetical protein